MSNKTEQPTPKKLRDARKDGQIAKSQELPATATTLALFAVVFLCWDYFYRVLEEMLTLPVTVMNRPFEEVAYPTVMATLVCIAKIVLPVIVSVMVVGTVANLVQVGVSLFRQGGHP